MCMCVCVCGGCCLHLGRSERSPVPDKPETKKTLRNTERLVADGPSHAAARDAASRPRWGRAALGATAPGPGLHPCLPSQAPSAPQARPSLPPHHCGPRRFSCLYSSHFWALPWKTPVACHCLRKSSDSSFTSTAVTPDLDPSTLPHPLSSTWLPQVGLHACPGLSVLLPALLKCLLLMLMLSQSPEVCSVLCPALGAVGGCAARAT